MKDTLIYGLVDPRGLKIRYIGQTDDLAKRLSQHVADKSNTPKVEWIRGLHAAGLSPLIVQLAEVPESENAHAIEYRWIYFGRKNGWELTNTAGMKSEDYHSMQGYFERLIVEMERPEDAPSRLHTMAEAKQDMVNLVVKITGAIASFEHWSVALCVAAVFACIGTAVRSASSSPQAVLAGLISFISAMVALFAIAACFDKEARPLASKILGIVALIDACAAVVIFIVR